ncbi:MAG: 2-polyprenyl-3-methyl-6-methoxy-1,4-benzoquinone monooxygenase [Comamonadaceae bacterium]|nr:2-polyprenyl-3-methyl-6-methoxy-1,4-benzoquinone monooxygenase [Comamonadaceae bacterium]
MAGRLMRVNHAGEISAQAPYQGQALTARLPTVRARMEQASVEENDHLAWTEERIRALGTHRACWRLFWYAGSFAIGALAGIAGDKWSLGFVVETERQVVRHLDDHLARLPAHDARDRAILEQMRADEAHHATTALGAGAAELPTPVKSLMQLDLEGHDRHGLLDLGQSPGPSLLPAHKRRSCGAIRCAHCALRPCRSR